MLCEMRAHTQQLLCLSSPSLVCTDAEGHNGKNTYFLGFLWITAKYSLISFSQGSKLGSDL